MSNLITASTGPVPVIDISPLISSNESALIEARSGIAAAVDKACRETGFFYIAGFGIDEGLLSRVWDVTRWFFDLPREDKRVAERSEENSRGYYDRELTKNIRDMKEVFDFGHVPNPSLPEDHPDNITEDGWNLWPTAEGSSEFKKTLNEYYDACGRAAIALLKVMASNLSDNHGQLIRDFYPQHSSFLRLNYYPVKDPLADDGSQSSAGTGHMGVHHHTDAGAFTLLLQDDVAGLQIHHGGAWIPVDPIPGTVVVNTGDIVQVWSNDRYTAPLHRVVASRDKDRYSLPYFFNPRYSANYAPVPGLLSESKPARYSSINWGHFRKERQHGDYGDYGKEIQISDFRISA
ncbi:MAG TPA: 2OG-Fe(II) oxygenase family protein [Xanthomonadales bacterium]|nr:2OG-Fe(II) oxygenase family protein [Xanthomonadales bacterium]